MQLSLQILEGFLLFSAKRQVSTEMGSVGDVRGGRVLWGQVLQFGGKREREREDEEVRRSMKVCKQKD